MKSIRSKLYFFVILTVVIIASGSIILSYKSNARQIDAIYKDLTTANAKNFAATLDGDFLRDLRVLLESDEYQAIRAQAVEKDNNLIVQNYLEEKGVWEQYLITRCEIDHYIQNMNAVKYIYIVAHGNAKALEDMYMIDDSTVDLYDAAGRYEYRGDEFLNRDVTISNPTITYDDEWGWLCSDYAPVYDSNGVAVAIVGCDIDYTQVAMAQRESLFNNVLITVTLAILVLVGALFIITKYIINPLKEISEAVKEFKPASDTVEANVINLGIKRKDEIGEIYTSIRSNQIMIVDYIKDITEMKEDLSEKDVKISKLSLATFKDALTNVGNKGAYMRKIEELNNSSQDYALVMVDINNLKEMNDLYGHKAGDWYIQGCCHAICKTFRHSPVYRIGGDEFVVVVENEDYPNRHLRYEELVKIFEIGANKDTEKPWEKLSAACGMAENASDDNSAELVFKRADKAMYANKIKFKKEHGSYR